MTLSILQVEDVVNDWWTSAYKLMKTLGDTYPGAAAAAATLRQLTDDFRGQVPLIHALASRSLEERHWAAISTVAGHAINPIEEDVTLQQLMDSGISKHFEAIEAITVQAEKEHNLRKALEGMKREWDKVIDCAYACIRTYHTHVCA